LPYPFSIEVPGDDGIKFVFSTKQLAMKSSFHFHFKSLANFRLSPKGKNYQAYGSWLERIVLKSLKNIAIAGATALSVVAGLQEANGQMTAFPLYGIQNKDPNIQHHNLNGGRVHWNYYGSGDANGDGTINNADYIAIQQGASNDRTDLNGDGVTNSADLGLLNNFLNGQIKYLPAHWDLLQTRTEREFWNAKAIAIDSTNFVINSGWDCTERTNQTMINFDGVEKLDSTVYNHNLHDFTKNARFNIPTYFVHTYTAGGISHALNAIFVGDSTHKLTHWQFFEGSNDQIVLPGISPWMDGNSFANIQKMMYQYLPSIQNFGHVNMTIINFDLSNGNGTVVNSGTAVPTTRTLVPLEPSNEVIPNDTLISLGQSSDTSNTAYVTNISPGADVFYNDSIVDFGNGNSEIHRKFSWKPFHHYIDSNAPTTLLKEHPWYWLNVDSLGTQIIQVMDDQAPIVSVTSPVYSVPFGSQVPSPQFNISDNSGLAVNVNYVGDSTTQQSNGCGKFNYEQWLKYEFSDPAGNVINKTFKNAEIYKPNESLQFVHIPQDTIAWMKWDQPNLGDLENSVKAEDVLYPENNLVYNYTMAPQSSSGNLQKYDVSVEVSGECGCSRDTSFVAIHDLVNSTNSIEAILSANIYPNPTKGVLHLFGNDEGYKSLNWEIFSIEGKLLGYGNEPLFGKLEIEIDLSFLHPGFYTLSLTSDGGASASHRIILY